MQTQTTENVINFKDIQPSTARNKALRKMIAIVKESNDRIEYIEGSTPVTINIPNVILEEIKKNVDKNMTRKSIEQHIRSSVIMQI